MNVIKSPLCFSHQFLSNIISRSFRFRLVAIILSIILCFSFICKPREVHAAATTVSISTIAAVCGIIAGATGILFQAGNLYLHYKEYKKSSETEAQMLDYWKNNISIDGDGNYVLTDDAKLTINGMMESYNDSVTYVNAYSMTSAGLVASDFSNLDQYKYFVNLVKNNPNLAFTYNCSLGDLYVNVIYSLSAAISDYSDMQLMKSALYDTDWNGIGQVKRLWIVGDCSSVNYDKTGYNAFYSVTSIDGIENVENFDLSKIPFINSSTPSNCYLMLHRDKSYSSEQFSSVLVSDMNGSIPVFKNLVDLKNGVSNGVEGNYVSGYTGQGVTSNVVDSHDVNNIINNYYGTDPDNPGGDDDDDDGGGSSGNILTDLLHSIGNIGEVIMSLFAKILSIITDIVKFFSDTILNAVDIVPEGFVSLLSALFPFVPKEWLTAASLFISLALIGFVIKMFVK